MQIKVINNSNNPLPNYETPSSAGMDLRANLNEDIVLSPLARAMVPTGLFIEIPEGFEAQIRPRSGLAAKHGISVINAPGTIDADYRGEIKVILVNLSNETFTISHADRIAQIIFAPITQASWQLTEELSNTQRGSGGFGSTGKQ